MERNARVAIKNGPISREHRPSVIIIIIIMKLIIGQQLQSGHAVIYVGHIDGGAGQSSSPAHTYILIASGSRT